MSFRLGKKSLDTLKGVHPDLVAIVKRAIGITTQDFTVFDGVRTIEEQRKNVANGVSWTMNSRHIPGKNGYSHAVDLVPWIKGKPVWDWPGCRKIAQAVKQAAQELRIPITWGGDWKRNPDGPHFELPVTSSYS